MTWWIRGPAAAALCASGALTFAAAAERWSAACPWGGNYDAPACIEMQSHAFDFLALSVPDPQLASAMEYAGWSMLALAVAALLLPFALRPTGVAGHPGRADGSVAAVVALVLGVVPFVAFAIIGAVVVRAGESGRPWADSVAFGVATFIWVLAWPAALTLFAGFAPGVAHRASAVTAAVLVGLSTSLSSLLLFGQIAAGGYVSHDSTPWAEATAAPFLFAAAVVLCIGGRRGRGLRRVEVSAWAAPGGWDPSAARRQRP